MLQARRPATHAGGVDIFLEAMEIAESGDILVIDNQGRPGEGCIGDRTVLEGQAAGLAGIVVWGCHRANVAPAAAVPSLPGAARR